MSTTLALNPNIPDVSEITVQTEPSLRPTLGSLEVAFQKLNERFFESSLSKPVITVSPNPSRKDVLGWCTSKRVWQDGQSEGYFEINICAEFLGKSLEDICSVLLHEMCHLMSAQNGVDDTSHSGTYHNKRFKKTAEAHGLIVEKEEPYGYSKTSLAPEAIDFIKTLENTEFKLYRPKPTSKERPPTDCEKLEEKNKDKPRTEQQKIISAFEKLLKESGSIKTRGKNPKKRNRVDTLKKRAVSLRRSVPMNLLSTKGQAEGFYVGRVSFLGIEFDVVKPYDIDGHILVIGGTGTGKSSCIAMPNLSSWLSPIVCIDIKGELLAHYRKLLASGKTTRPFIKFAPMEEDGWRYDPFELLRQSGDEYLVQYVKEIVLSIIPLPPDTREPFWIEVAQNFLTTALLYYYELGASFSEAIIGVQTTPQKTLVDKIVDSKNENALMFINQIRELGSKTLAGITTEMSNKIMVFATDPFISEAFGIAKEDKKCFSWKDLENHNIFLCIPEDKIEQWHSIITLMVNQLFRVLERRPDKHSRQGSSVTPALLLFEEFARLGKVEIANAVSTLRSKNVTIAVFIQSLAQLDLIYGECTRRIIADNCSYKVLLGANDPQSQKYMSELVGSHEIEKKSYTTHYPQEKMWPEKRMLDGTHSLCSKGQIKAEHSVHVSTQYEPIIRPEEFGRMKDILLITPEGHSRVKKSPYYDEDEPKKENPVWEAAKWVLKPAAFIVGAFSLVAGVGLLIALGLSKK